jgi:hypothetical protein
MLTENEKQILGIFNERLLVRKDELKSLLNQSGFNDGIVIINKLSGMGYLKFIEAVGSPCYTITQDGIRVLKG